MKRHLTAGTAIIMALLLGAAALAQSNSPRDAKACAPGADSHLKTDATTPHAPKLDNGTTGSGTSLSDTLAQSNGVLCPPNVDPEIKAPTPEDGKMPIIPPPGSPGGNPNIQPK